MSRKLLSLQNKLKRQQRKQMDIEDKYQQLLNNMTSNQNPNDVIKSAASYINGYALELFRTQIGMATKHKKSRRYSEAVKSLACVEYVLQKCTPL